MGDGRNVVEVLSRGGGSGYHLGGGLVLTAAHLLPDDSIAPRIRFLDARDWFEGRTVWLSTDSIDVALVQVAEPMSEPSRRVLQWGKLVDDGPAVRCEVVGFLSDGRSGAVRDIEQLFGTINPLTGSRSGLLAVSLSDAPMVPYDGGSPWMGMSGAPVWSGDQLVAVVVQDAPEFGGRRLLAVPVARLVADERFAELVTKATGRRPNLEIANPSRSRDLQPVEQGPFDVFLSYTHTDIPFARMVDAYLSQAGLAVFFAERIIQLGDDINRVIEDALVKSRAFVIILSASLSSASLSEGSWVARELAMMRARITQGDGLIIPIYIGDADIPEHLSTFRGVDLRGVTDEGKHSGGAR